MTRITYIADPLNKPASWDDVRSKYIQMVTKPYYYASWGLNFNFDIDTATKYKSFLDTWSTLPSAAKDVWGKIVVFDIHETARRTSQPELQALHSFLLDARADRLSVLDARLAALKAMTSITFRDIETSAWGVA